MEVHGNNTGFTRITHDLLNTVLISELNQREIKIVLLIIRTTVGCKTDWAKIRKTDLQIVGISNSHAKEVIESMTSKAIILRNEKNKGYKLNELFFKEINKVQGMRCEKLSKFIGKHLPKSSPNGKINLPEMGIKKFPLWEDDSSQNRKSIGFPNKEVFRSSNDDFSTAKDILKKKLNISDK